MNNRIRFPWILCLIISFSAYLVSCDSGSSGDEPLPDQYLTMKINGSGYVLSKGIGNGTINGVVFTGVPIASQLTAPNLYFLASEQVFNVMGDVGSGNLAFRILIIGCSSTGTYSGSMVNMSYEFGSADTKDSWGDDTATATVTVFGAIDDYIEGTFSGTMEHGAIDITGGSFRVKRIADDAQPW
jgi:hypothetical protein